MAYTKPLVKTEVYYHGGSSTIVFQDAITDGEVVRYGTNVRKQLLHGDTIDSIDNGGTHYVIPYHAVIYAEIKTSASEEQTKPEDKFCVKE